MSPAKVYTPISPLPSYFSSNPRGELSATEQSMYNEVLAHFSPGTYALPNVEKGELSEFEKFWVSRECILRYLRASKWKVDTAIQRLENSLKWRREYGLYDKLTPEYVELEALTGKEILFGFSSSGKPAFYMVPSRQNTQESPRQVEFAVWMLERSIDLMPAGVENVAWLINFAQRAKNPSLGIARQVVNILQDHYPERLGLALAINVPFLISAFFKLVLPFVDPVTREKLKFNPNVVKDGLFAEDQCMADAWGGSQDFEYVHETYWKALVHKAKEARAKHTAKWKDLGANVGISEWDYKEGEKAASGEDIEETEADGSVSIPKPKEAIVTVLDVPESEPVSIPTTLAPSADAVPMSKVTEEEERKHKDTIVTNTTVVGGSGHGGTATAGATATGGGDGGDAGADGGAAAE